MDNNSNEYINNRGEKVPRVSSIIKLLNKEQLLYWANSLGYKHISYAHELDRTARIGSAVHDMIEKYHDKHKLAIYNWGKYRIFGRYDRIAVMNCMRSFREWYDIHHRNFKVLFTEKTIVGDLFGGTIDTIIESPMNKKHIMIVDYKTSSGFYLTQILQLSAYVYLCEKEGFIVDGVMVIKMDKKFGDSATDLILLREDLDPFIALFMHLYESLILHDISNRIMKTKNKRLAEVVL